MKSRLLFGVAGILGLFGLLSCKAFDYASVASRVFEVVVKVNLEDKYEYDKEVPESELSFYEKNRKYDSIGTAFAVGSGKFISAAHVFDLLSPSLSKGYYLRDSKGTIYNISNVIAYDYSKDYIVFTVPELKVEGLSLAKGYEFNTKVFSVGNALGEGIVFRDGMLTSLTPDDEKGKWNWLRFSAPASPGNSGGPLVNEQGQVLGIIEMKSESENLNYALPISEVQFDNVANFDFTYTYESPVFQDTRFQNFELQVKLPLTGEELAKKSQQPFRKFVTDLGEDLRIGSTEDRFPTQEGAKAIIGKPFDPEIIAGIVQKPDSTWQFYDSPLESQSYLKSGGSVEFGSLWGYTTFAMRSDFYIEPLLETKSFMERLLSAYNITRSKGVNNLRVKSMGEASRIDTLTDVFDREWTLLQYDDPVMNETNLVLCFEVPNGLVGLISNIEYRKLDVYRQDLKIIADHLYLTYQGTVPQWQKFLVNQSRENPWEIRNLRFEVTEKKGHKTLSLFDGALDLAFDLESPMFVDTEVDELTIRLAPSFSLEERNWSVGTIKIDPSGIGDKFYQITRVWAPDLFSDKKERGMWDRMLSRKAPFDGQVSTVRDSKQVKSIIEPAMGRDSASLYVLETNVSQEINEKTAKKMHQFLERGFVVHR